LRGAERRSNLANLAFPLLRLLRLARNDNLSSPS
jgi:hypothetical protein